MALHTSGRKLAMDSPEDEEEDTPPSPSPNSSRLSDRWKRTSTLIKDGTGMAPSTPQSPDTGQSGARSAEVKAGPCKKVAEKAENDDLRLNDFILDPNGKVAYYWMGVVAAAVMYNCAVIILRVAFQELREHAVYQKVFSTLDNLSDLVYLLDIGVQARTAYLEDGCLILDPEKLLRHYRGKTRFIVDVLSILPLTTAYSVMTGLLSLLPLRPLLHDASHLAAPIMRIARLLKYHTLSAFFQATDSHTSNPNLLRAFKLSVHLWMVIHWIGCVYFMVSEYEGLGSNEWVYPSGEEYTALARKYILCTYWSTMTLTTIGERPSPVTDLEYVFTGLTFLIGVFVFAAVVGNVGDVISNMYAAKQDFQARMDQIKFYMQHRQVPEHLQDRVKKWAAYTWNRTKAIDEPSVLQLLPERLRTEIAIHVHLDTLKKVKIFEECEEGLLRELVLKLRPQIYSPGDYICRIGEIGREMYILNHGKVEILVPSSAEGRRTQVAILNPGNYFGEISLLKLDDGQNRRTADVRAIGYSELLCLSRRDLLSAMVEYPNAKEILEAQAKERMMQTKGVQKSDANAPKSNAAPRRKARDIFADVMRQEGFAKLLSARGQEMNDLQKVIADLKSVISQVSTGSKPQPRCECEELQRRLRQKDRSLKKANRRVVELETILRIRNRSASLPVAAREHVPRQDSGQSEDSYVGTGSDVIGRKIYAMATRSTGQGDVIDMDDANFVSVSRGSSFEGCDHFTRTEVPLSGDQLPTETATRGSGVVSPVQQTTHGTNGHHNESSPPTITDSMCTSGEVVTDHSSVPDPLCRLLEAPAVSSSSQQVLLAELQAALAGAEPGLSLSDASTNSDNSSIDDDDIDDL